MNEGRREGEQRDGWTSGEKGGRVDVGEKARMFVCMQLGQEELSSLLPLVLYLSEPSLPQASMGLHP